MLIERNLKLLNLGVVEGADEIAWNYLHKTGAIVDETTAHDKILIDIMQMYNRGERSRLKLGNKAISHFAR